MKAQKTTGKVYERTFTKFGLTFNVVLTDFDVGKYEWLDDWSYKGFKAYMTAEGYTAEIQIKRTPRYGVGYYIVDNGLKPLLPYKTIEDILKSDSDEQPVPIKDPTADELYAIELETVKDRLTMSANRKHALEVMEGKQIIELRKESNIKHETIWVTKDIRDGALLSLIDVTHIFMKPHNSGSEYDLQFALYPEYAVKLNVDGFTFNDAYNLVKDKLNSEVVKAERRVRRYATQNSVPEKT